MAKSKKAERAYRHHGLEFKNLEFGSPAERKYVQDGVERVTEKLRELRIAKGWSQEKLAEQASASTATIRAIEGGQRAPSLPMVLKFLYLLDRSAVLLK